MRTGAARLEPHADDRADDGGGAGDRDDHAGGVGARLRRRRTCWWPRTSGCGPAPRSRTRGSTGPRREIARALQTSLLPPHLPDIPGAPLAAAYPPGVAGARGRRRLLRRLHDRRGPVVPRDRRRLRQGRRGGGGDRARALHAAHGRRAAALAGGDPALGRRGDAPPGRGGRALLHDRLRARGPGALAGAADGVLRRASAAGAAARGRAASSWSATPGTLLGLLPDPELQERTHRPAPGDTLVLYTDGLTEARAPHGMWGYDGAASPRCARRR